MFRILDFLIIFYFRISAGQSHILSDSGQRNISCIQSFSLADFKQMMNHLPEPVADQEIMEMFNTDRDGRIKFEEFLVRITPVKVPDAPIIYGKPKQLNKNNKNTVLANGTADHEGPASLATNTL